MERFLWVVSDPSCTPFKPWERTGFCHAMAGRSLYMIGDSLTGQMALNLQMLASNGSGSSFRLVNRSESAWFNTLVCQETNPVITPVLANPKLALDRGRIAPTVVSVREFLGPISAAHGLRPDVILVNRGAHFDHTAVLLQDVRAFLRHVRTMYPSSLVIWRDTPPGHTNCSSYDRPMAVRQPPGNLPFRWGEFHDQNAAVAALIRDKFEGVIYADVTTATSLRADRHNHAADCLHYSSFSPGPIDHWMRLLYNIVVLVGNAAAASNGARTGMLS